MDKIWDRKSFEPTKVERKKKGEYVCVLTWASKCLLYTLIYTEVRNWHSLAAPPMNLTFIWPTVHMTPFCCIVCGLSRWRCLWLLDRDVEDVDDVDRVSATRKEFIHYHRKGKTMAIVWFCKGTTGIKVMGNSFKTNMLIRKLPSVCVYTKNRAFPTTDLYDLLSSSIL